MDCVTKAICDIIDCRLCSTINSNNEYLENISLNSTQSKYCEI